ncbi:hypothetical protein EDB84DRAFT_1658332, partial [Lactarius hengduanensis]
MGNAAGARQSVFGPQGVQNTDAIMGIVAGASEATLERNAFYVGLKTMASNRATEIEALKGTIEQKTQEIVGRDKEIDILKARCETLEGAIDRFARDYHSLKGAGGDESQIAFLTDLGPMPAPWKRNENPEVTIWMKREFATAAAKAKAQKGESSGDPSDTNKTKGKAGRPSKKDQEEVGHPHIYLQRRDGTPISIETLGNMSVKARSIWDFLLKKGMATPTFCKLPWDASDFFGNGRSRTTRAGPAIEDSDRRTPTRMRAGSRMPWTTQSLIRMKSSDNSNDSIRPDENGSESDDHRIEETTPGTEDAGVPQRDDDPGETPGPSTQLPRGPIVPGEHPDPLTLSSRGPVQSVIANPFAPMASSSSLGTRTGVTRVIPPPTAPASSAPVQTSEDATTAAQTHAATSGTLKEASAAATKETLPDSDDPSRPTGTTPPGGSDPAATANGAIPPQRRIKFIVRPQADTTVVEGDQDTVAPPVPSVPAQTLMAGPSDGQPPTPPHPIPAPADAPIPNLR